MIPIDTLNKFIVGVQGSSVVIGLPPRLMGSRDALLLAAYLVAMADIIGNPNEDGKFEDWLQAVKST